MIDVLIRVYVRYYDGDGDDAIYEKRMQLAYGPHVGDEIQAGAFTRIECKQVIIGKEFATVYAELDPERIEWLRKDDFTR